MSNFHSNRHNVGQSIRLDELRIGMSIHLSYTNFGNVWRIESIEKDGKGEVWLNLRAPVSGNFKRTRAVYAKHIRANERRLFR